MTDQMICPICRSGAVRYVAIPDATYFRCPKCASLFQHPTPTITDLREYADRQYTQGLYKAYVGARELKYATFRERMRRITERSQGGRLLDVGCASGFLIDVALANGFDAHGIEFSQTAVEAASEEAAPRIKVADVNEIESLGDQPYNVVTAFDIVEHTLDPIRFLRGLRSCLVPQGLLVLTTPDTRHFLRYLMGRRWPMLQPFQHTVLFSRKSMEMALAESGFEHLSFMPATKILSLDYLIGQVEGYLPWLGRAYHAVGSRAPTQLRTVALPLRIGEMMVFATRAE